MSDLVDAARSIALTLNQADFPYAVCEGLAVGIHTEPRATMDVDICLNSENDAQEACNLLTKEGWLTNTIH